MKKHAIAVIAVALLSCSTLARGADTTVGNGTELRTLLVAGQTVATLQPIAAQQGCGTGGCVVRLDRVTVLRDRGALRDASGRTLELVQHAPGHARDLPAINWNPLQAFHVVRGDDEWGTCIEFGHAGVGASGSFQRWRTIVLVPAAVASGGAMAHRPVAHRFVGYWAGCDSLVTATGAGEVVLPIVEPIATHAVALHLTWQHCTAGGCRSVDDARTVVRAPASETGALVVGGS